MIKSIIFNILFSIGAGFLLSQLQIFLQTHYLTNFLKENLITLLVALIAINSATLSIVLTKIKELLDKNGQQGIFENTKKQMILSINEQLTLIIMAILLLTIQDSILIKTYQNYVGFLNILIISCFVYALRVLHDTSKSVFVILDY